ncbi:MAG TPA: spore coat protein CotJB [Bacillota bacterium]|jgi:spore coat protein JB|nr:spore coat protein CotJB [Bacillota bacterium]
MLREQLELLNNIKAVEFTALELNLYLDTHPTDQRAIMDYNASVQEWERLRAIYVEKYGPLLPTDIVEGSSWRWIEGPWPWEIDY